MYSVRFCVDRGKLEIDGKDFKRRLFCPISRQNKLNDKNYFFEELITKRNGFAYLPNSIKWSKSNSLFVKRVWDSFWREGWREMKQ